MVFAANSKKYYNYPDNITYVLLHFVVGIHCIVIQVNGLSKKIPGIIKRRLPNALHIIF